MYFGPLSTVSPRLRVLFFGFVSLVACHGARAQATASAVSFGNVNVGTPATATVTFTFSASTTVASVSVVTQGATGLDFQPGTQVAGACAAGMYAANATCNVKVNFTPLAAGLRSGAALLVDGSGNTVGVGYVSGSGTGATFETDNTAATQLINNDYPSQIIPDAAGNLYVGQLQTGSAVKLTPAGVKTSIAGASKNPYSIAVDGAGSIYIFDGLSDVLYRTDPASGTQTTFVSGLAYGFGLATDPLGNVYVGQGGSAASGTILKYSSSGTLLATINVPASPTAIISDASGNLYYTVYMGGLYTIAAGGTTSALVSTPPSYDYVSLAFDAAGNLYIAVDGNVLYEMPAGTHTLNAIITDSSMSTFILGVGVDGIGNLLYGKNGSLYKVDRTHPTASLPGTTMIGSTSAEKTVSYRNIGSAPSAISAITASANGKVGPSNTCSAATPVAINATCVASLQFAPVAQGSPQNATLTLTGPLTAPVFTLTGDVAGDPTQLGFTSGPPATLISGSSPGTVTVAIQDNSGTNVMGLTDSLTLTISGAASPPPVTVSAVNGVATFNLSGTTLTTVGTYTFTVTDNTRSLTGATTTELVLPKYLTVVPGSLNPVATSPDAMTVTAYDNAGNQATAYSGYVALTSTDAAATLPAAFALSSGQGAANVTFRTLGSQTVTARDSTTGLITGTSSSIQVRAVPSYIVTTATDDNGSALASNCSDQSVSGATHDSSCSLRDAIAATNALNFTGTTNAVPMIGFAPALSGSTVTLAAALTPTANVNIAGPGAASLTIAPATTYSYAAFKSTTNSIAFTLSGVTVTGFGIPGSTTGAALYFSPSSGSVADMLTLSNDAFTSNGGTPGGTTASNNGGAVLVYYSTLVISGSTFTGNSAFAGAALCASGASVTINGSTFGTQAAPNRGLSSQGGAIYLAASPATIGTSTFAYNTASNGAGIDATGALTLNSDVFLNNAATTSGGAVYTTSTLTVAGGTFNNNTAKTSGGAIYGTGQFTVSGSSFTANQTGTYGGAMYETYSSGINSISNSNFIGNKIVATGTIAYGGAVYLSRADLTNVLFSGNSAANGSFNYGGGAYYNGAYTSTFTGVTFTGNSSPIGLGGGVYANSSILAMYNTTVSGNSSRTGGGIYKMNGTLNLYNSVVSGNTATSTYPDFYVTVTSANSSYVGAGSSSSCTTSCTPLLSALGNYGGGTVGAPGYTTPVQMMLPLPGSPLLAAGNTTYVYNAMTNPSVGHVLCNGVATEPDARGCSYPRTLTEAGSSHVDIGAAEANYSLSFVTQPVNTAVNAALLPPPTVQLYESGVPFTAGAGQPLNVAAQSGAMFTTAADSTAFTSVAITASGLESATPYFSAPQSTDALVVSVQSGAATPVTVASATSATFNITNAAATLGFGTPPPAQLMTGVSPGTVTVRMLTSTGAVYTAGADAITLTVTATGYTTATYTATAVNGIASFTPAALSAAGTYTYTASDTSASPYTTDTVAATETVAADTVDHFTVTGVPIRAAQGTAYTVTVTAIDPSGATDAAFTGPVFLASTDTAATFTPQNYTYTVSDAGVHTFSVTLNTGGPQTVSVSNNTGQTGAETGIVVAGTVWTVNAAGTLSKLSSGGVALLGPVGMSGTASALGGVAIDATGNAWSVTQQNNTLNFVTKGGTGAVTYSGNGLNAPVAVAIDGAGMVWVANSAGNTVSAFTNAGAAALSSATDTRISGGSGVAIDVSGNVWITNATGNSVDEVLGAASPVGPLATGATNGVAGTRP